MKFLGAAVALILLASACTMDPISFGSADSSPGSNSMGGQVHLPLTYENWQVQRYTLKNDTPACAISSGYNGLTVFVSRQSWGLDEAVQSNRMMQPGSDLTVEVGGQHFESYETFFSRETAKKLVAAMAGGGKLYLEWSEINAPVGREHMRIQNIAKLDDFGAKLKQCRDSIGH